LSRAADGLHERPIMRRSAGDGGRDVDRPFALEAHYYEGGLRVRPLDTKSARPAWAPPPEYVGFRNEFTLEPNESVVEFARFAFQQRRITWLGVFNRAADQVFGDRQNHAGVGVWLLDSHIIDAGKLLSGLRQFATAVAEGKLDSFITQADRFGSKEYLPSYIRSDHRLPAALAGWPYSSSQMPDTSLFLATGDTQGEAWDSAAEQILRMSVLPSPKSASSRALIHVRAASVSGTQDQRQSKLVPVKRGLLEELLSSLPKAIGDFAAEHDAMSNRVEELTRLLREKETSLSDERQETQRLRERSTQLEQDVADSDILKRLGALDRRLAVIDERTSTISAALRNVRSDIAFRPDRIDSQSGARPANEQPPSDRQVYTEMFPRVIQTSGTSRRQGGGRLGLNTRGRGYVGQLILTAILGLIIILIALLIWKLLPSSPQSVPSLDLPGR
jgi:hypothetical protein